jgi:hypothetical protein
VASRDVGRTHSQQVKALEPLSRYYCHEFHFAQERDFGGQKAHGMRECHLRRVDPMRRILA